MKNLFLILMIASLIPILNTAQSVNKKPFVQSNKEITNRFLQSFNNAFNAHDIKTIMLFMTEDCVFEASAGEEMDGEKFTGQEEVRKAFENVFETFHNYGA